MKEKLVLQTFVILDWLVAGLVFGPVDTRCVYQAPNSTESLRTVLLHTSISTVLTSALKDPQHRARKGKGTGCTHIGHLLKTLVPAPDPQTLKAKQALSQQLLHQTQGE